MPYSLETWITFRQAASALNCSTRDIKEMVLAGKLYCINFGHDKDRILMNSSRVHADRVKELVLAQFSVLLAPLLATADVRIAQREAEDARIRSQAWKEEWERRHTGEGYYNPDGQWYVYTLSTPADRIFYVGKGCGPRVHQHEQEARKGHNCHKCHTIRKVWKDGGEIKKAIVFRSHSEQAAYDYESTLIARVGLRRLTNVQPGGGKVVSTGPKRDEGVTSFKEQRYYLTLRGVDEKDIDRIIRNRIRERIEILTDRIYVLRRYNFGRQSREDSACELEQEVIGLQAALGDFEQMPLFD